MDTPVSTEPRAGRREWVGLATLALPTVLTSLDLSVLFLALPKLSDDLNPSSTQQLWITDIYAFMIAGFLLTMGTVGDRIGHRKLLMAGATFFGIASVVAAYSVNAEMLIGARALLGVAGATLMPSTMGLISNMFANPKERSVAIASWMSAFVVGVAIGPLVGGVLLDNFWWGSVFLMGVPIMVLLLATGPFLLPETRPTAARRLDLVSVALSMGAILPIVWGIKEMARDGYRTSFVVAIAVGVVVGIGFVRRQLVSDDPLLDLRMFKSGAFSASVASLLVGGTSMGASTLFVTQYLQLVQGFSPIKSGLWLLPAAFSLIIGSMLSPALAQKIRPGHVIAAGLLIAVAGHIMLAQVDSSPGVALLITGYSIVYFGAGPFGALGTDMVVGSAPPEKAGTASAVAETGTQLGIALGVALLGSAGTAVYRDHMSDAVPAGVPHPASEAARDTLAGAVDAAGKLPGGVGRALLEPARTAFSDGIHIVATIGAIDWVLLAVVVAIALRRVPPMGKAAAPEQAPAEPELKEAPRL